MKSTEWSDSSLRIWLKEFEVLGVEGTPSPTDTPTPTSTPTPTPSSTPSEQGTMHVGDLDGSSRNVGRNWKARVTITVHDGNEMPLANASVSGSWSDGNSGTGSCVTDQNGQCSLDSGKIGAQSVTFSVDGLLLAPNSYVPAANHDPDGDSDGTVIAVSKP
jgi:hypothetical protein